MTLADLGFAVVAALACASALGVLVFRNVLHAAISLFFTLIGVAILYVFLSADFLAVAQLVVYAGGILVLIVFGVLLTTRIYDVRYELKGWGVAWGWLVAPFVTLLTAQVILQTTWPVRAETVRAPSTAALGQLLLTKYLLPFELISVLLVLAAIGAVSLVRKEIKGERP